jgi:dUTP pyrophosphatase
MHWIKIKRLYADSIVPQYHSEQAAGLDLHSYEDTVIGQGDIVLVKTGIAMEIPKGYVGMIKDRSGMAMDYYYTHAGIIDSDYRGEVKVLLHNDDSTWKEIKKGQRIAQLLLIPCPQMTVSIVDELSMTERNQGGFGSTGGGAYAHSNPL